ncbi:G-protein coupled receptor 4 [Labeo rohita]|uniref:G-protein coupled receptor 4 n=1 Tax=Labeo rohita TaxID=84645 RepID=A0ABQ8M0L9_LABRO|nr:G-protein coupled receptor 4 [Labeo rohita]
METPRSEFNTTSDYDAYEYYDANEYYESLITGDTVYISIIYSLEIPMICLAIYAVCTLIKSKQAAPGSQIIKEGFDPAVVNKNYMNEVALHFQVSLVMETPISPFNTTSDYDAYEYYKPLITGRTVYISIIACLEIPMICLAIYAVYFLIKSKQAASVFVINLLISDLIQIVCMLLLVLEYQIIVFLGITLIWAGFTGPYFMTCIAVERYILIAHPIWHRTHHSVKCLVCISLIGWLISFIVILINLECVIIMFFIYYLVIILCFIGSFRSLSHSISLTPLKKQLVLGPLFFVVMSYTFLILPLPVCLVWFNLTNLVLLSYYIYMLNPLVDCLLYVFMRSDAENIIRMPHCCSRLKRVWTETGQTTFTFTDVQSDHTKRLYLLNPLVDCLLYVFMRSDAENIIRMLHCCSRLKRDRSRLLMCSMNMSLSHSISLSPLKKQLVLAPLLCVVISYTFLILLVSVVMETAALPVVTSDGDLYSTIAKIKTNVSNPNKDNTDDYDIILPGVIFYITIISSLEIPIVCLAIYAVYSLIKSKHAAPFLSHRDCFHFTPYLSFENNEDHLNHHNNVGWFHRFLFHDMHSHREIPSDRSTSLAQDSSLSQMFSVYVTDRSGNCWWSEVKHILIKSSSSAFQGVMKTPEPLLVTTDSNLYSTRAELIRNASNPSKNSTDDFKLDSGLFMSISVISSLEIPMICLAIYAVYSLIKSKHAAPVFVINLLISDLIQIIWMLVFFSYKTVPDLPLIGIIWAGFTGNCFMTCIAVERYILISHPIWHRSHHSVKCFVCTSLTGWLLSLIIFLMIFTEPVPTFYMPFIFYPVIILCFVGSCRSLSHSVSFTPLKKQLVLAPLFFVVMTYTFFNPPI